MQVNFINAIKTVLKLENENIYIAVVIEDLIEKVKESDYNDVILYLAKRKSDYEAPLESLAKGIDEFYKIKNKPILEYATKRASELQLLIHSLLHYHGKDKTIELIEAEKKFTMYDNTITINTEDIDAINKCGGLKYLLENHLDIGEISELLYKQFTSTFYQCDIKIINNEETLLLANK